MPIRCRTFRSLLALTLTLLIALPSWAKEKYPRTHWVEKTYAEHWHHSIDFWQAFSYAGAVEVWSKQYGLDPDWMTGLFTWESHWSRNAADKKGSYGIPQLQIPTAQAVLNNSGNKAFKASPEALRRFTGLSIKIACKHFKDLLLTYDGDYIKATRAYNAGSGNVDRGHFKDGRKDVPGGQYFEDVWREYKLYREWKNAKMTNKVAN